MNIFVPKKLEHILPELSDGEKLILGLVTYFAKLEGPETQFMFYNKDLAKILGWWLISHQSNTFPLTKYLNYRVMDNDNTLIGFKDTEKWKGKKFPVTRAEIKELRAVNLLYYLMGKISADNAFGSDMYHDSDEQNYGSSHFTMPEFFSKNFEYVTKIKHYKDFLKMEKEYIDSNEILF